MIALPVLAIFFVALMILDDYLWHQEFQLYYSLFGKCPDCPGSGLYMFWRNNN